MVRIESFLKISCFFIISQLTITSATFEQSQCETEELEFLHLSFRKILKNVFVFFLLTDYSHFVTLFSDL